MREHGTWFDVLDIRGNTLEVRKFGAKKGIDRAHTMDISMVAQVRKRK